MKKDTHFPKGAVRDPKSGAVIFKKRDRGKNIDLRIFRKIIKEIYRVLPQESKDNMKETVKIMVELL